METKVYVTGDTHADWVDRLNEYNFPIGKTLTKDDFVIVCGDFGIWNNSEMERTNLEWLDTECPFTTLFVDGNHSNFDLLKTYPVVEWHGGKVHKINDSVYHLMRGQVYDIGGKKFFTFGGASSHDIQDGILEPNDPRIKQWRYDYTKMFRVNHYSWWKEELPSQEEMKEGIENLKKHDFKVDYIITHCPPSRLLELMDNGWGLYETDILTDYHQTVQEKTDYDRWFFGHMHRNTSYNGGKDVCLYEHIIKVM